jgi:hypothetical protein
MHSYLKNANLWIEVGDECFELGQVCAQINVSMVTVE